MFENITNSLPQTPKKAGIPLPQLEESPTLIRSPHSVSQTFDTIPTIPLSGVIPRITPQTLADIMDGKYDHCFDELYVIDCRFMYEFEGGHIRGATNVPCAEVLAQAFFENPFQNALIVFHCEFSKNRGPQTASAFRGFDRELNKHRYPFLFYPQVYVMNGGYREFYNRFPGYCDGGYVPMLVDEHRMNGDLQNSTNEFRRGIDALTVKKQIEEMAFCQHNLLKSPMAITKSPMTTRMMSMIDSPIPRRR